MKYYIITEEEAFHDEKVESTITAARKAKKELQAYLDECADTDILPREARIFKVELVE